MKRSLLLLLLPMLLPAGDLPDFHAGVLVLPDGFIALRIENAASRDWLPPAELHDRVFISLAINGIKRAEYLVKAVDPAIFRRQARIVFKTNFRAVQRLRMRVELNPERVIPESDFSNNICETELPPAP
ncbi:MAG TPA: hypothetical protein PK919_04785 [Candidatus Aminicenantes bacterium]|nr:hypothetical protein [Candidatus Aminicenantes bacterium]